MNSKSEATLRTSLQCQPGPGVDSALKICSGRADPAGDDRGKHHSLLSSAQPVEQAETAGSSQDHTTHSTHMPKPAASLSRERMFRGFQLQSVVG